MKVIAGMKFGKLTTVNSFRAGRKTMWNCICECGTEKAIRQDSLASGRTKSCGCIYKSIEFAQKARDNNFVDLSGHKIGRWLVLREADKSATGQIRYLCRCECGTEAIVHSGNLKNGTSTSCGCYKHTEEYGMKISDRNAEDIAGKHFGKWTALHRDPETINKTVRWICECECGTVKSVIKASLVDGSSTSCGCTIDLSGRRFGRWTAERKSYRIRPNGHRLSTYLCKCDCGVYRYVDGSRLLNGTSQSCGCMSSKAEQEISELLAMRNVDFDTQYSFDDLVSPNGYPLRFDFAIMYNGELAMLVEYQGEQHYLTDAQNSFGQFQREYSDPAKVAYCKLHNIPLFEIKYTEKIQERLDEILNTLHANPVPSSVNTEKV